MQSPSYFPRSYLTSYIIETLRVVIEVGDGIEPDSGGWNGPPEDPTSSYTPYVVLMPGTVGNPSGSIGDSQSDVQAPFTVTSYGVSRAMAERTSEAARKTAVAMVRTMVLLDDSDWAIQQVRASSVGGVVRNDSAETSKYSEVDVLTFYMSKEL